MNIHVILLDSLALEGITLDSMIIIGIHVTRHIYAKLNSLVFK